jgi:hypothetical protein
MSSISLVDICNVYLVFYLVIIYFDPRGSFAGDSLGGTSSFPDNFALNISSACPATIWLVNDAVPTKSTDSIPIATIAIADDSVFIITGQVLTIFYKQFTFTINYQLANQTRKDLQI